METKEITIERRPLVYRGYSKEVEEKLKEMGLTQYKSDNPTRVYTRIAVNSDRSNYVLFTEWEWNVTPSPDEEYECTDAKNFLEIIAFDLYKSSSCFDEAIDRCNDYNEISCSEFK